MHWQVIVALVVMIPVILLPVAIIWYLNIGRIKEAVANPLDHVVDFVDAAVDNMLLLPTAVIWYLNIGRIKEAPAGREHRLKNLLLPENDFAKFKQYCGEKGFDLSYSSPEISGLKEEIEWHQFDGPQVIKLTRGQFTFIGVPYTVAEWQQEKWGSRFSEIQEEFFSKRTPIA